MKDDPNDEVGRRVDPSGDLRQQLELFNAVNNPIGRSIFRLLGVDMKLLDQMAGLSQEVEDRFRSLALAVEVLPPLGWVPFSRMPDAEYQEATRLASAGDSTGANDLLVNAWNQKDRIRFGLQRLKALGAGSDKWQPVFMRRWELLDKARRYHEAGDFDASVPIVLLHIDGITADTTGDKDLGFYARRLDHLHDEETLAGMPEGLAAIASLFRRDVKTTGRHGHLRRHGIMHGRELGYDTVDNSTKSFAALFALIEWALPQMRRRIEDEQAERESLYAGSVETDEDGRLLDRRGFDEAKSTLELLAMNQARHFDHRGRYAADLDELLPGDLGERLLGGKSNFNLRMGPDGQIFWATRQTPTGYVFGIAGRAGDQHWWLYAGRGEPDGGIGDDDWRHITRDPSHIEW